MSSAPHSRGTAGDYPGGIVWDEAVDTHAPRLWRQLLAQAPSWQAADASDVAWLRLADALDEMDGIELGPWLEQRAQEALVEVRECPWRTPMVPFQALGDEPPPEILEGARNAIRVRLGDVAIARPNAHHGLAPTTERGMDIPWRADGDVIVSTAASWERTFETEGISIDLVLFAERERRLVGMVRGSDLADATIRTPVGDQTCDFEPSGWFRAVAIPEGPVSVVLGLAPDSANRRVVTEWRTL